MLFLLLSSACAERAFLGHDVVAYFGLPAQADGINGSSEFALNYTRHDGLSNASWTYELLFVSAENRDVFKSNPERFLPKWGGFCAYGVSMEMAPDWPWDRAYLGPPGASRNGWFIFDGSLYFMYFRSLIDKFNASSVALGDARWKSWFGSGGPLNYQCDADTWDDRPCTKEPQINAGITNNPYPLSDDCVAYLDSICGLADDCSRCLQKSFSASDNAGRCPTDGAAPAGIVNTCYCL